MDRTRTGNYNQPGQPTERLVYLVTRDEQFDSFVSQQVQHFGYSVLPVRDIKSLANVIAEHQSIAILVDIPPDDDPSPGKSIFTEIEDLQLVSSSLIFTSDRDDQTVRLKSIRAGGAAFFTKPINIVSLVDKLDALTRTSSDQAQSRVLIIDDQHTVASYYQMVLKMSGMDAQIVTDPNEVLEQVREYRPDLILMNSYLSEISGADLARVIRQIDDFVSIPIIFLSSDDDFARRIEALDLGGDDFLIKPIKASHLMAVVRSRLERSKTLRSYMVRDSLTNLLNHTAFRSALAQEVNRCKRQSTNLALAMLDIDHFKMVNDKYGHATGDSTLKGLSRLLQQRLRKYDIVGRYGGDEFVGLLIDCEAQQALKIMDEIRLHFSGIEFTSKDLGSLYLTFSCGISTFPEYQSAENLIDSADQALYIAKAGNRNQIIIAQT